MPLNRNYLLSQVDLGTLKGIGPLGNEKGELSNSFTGAISRFNNIISLVLAVLTVSAGLWFIFQVFGGALAWLGSGGEKQALQNAQKRISNAIVGLLVVVLSYALISIIGRIFGLDILQPFNALVGVKTAP